MNDDTTSRPGEPRPESRLPADPTPPGSGWLTADRSNEVRAAAELIDVPVINKPLKPAVLRSMITRFRRMAPAAAE